MSIQVSNLVKTYGEQKAVDNVSFSVAKGEIVGFLGPNGAGKSTTMKIVTGYLQPDGGDASVCGMDVLKSPLETKKKIEEVIQTVGLGSESKKKIGQLSKGYKQRVGLAGALIHDPEVLILDEPTTGLDPNQIIEIREVIMRLGKNKTVLFSSHILQEVEAVCDRVIIINKGKLVADDTLSNLQRNSNQQHEVLVSFQNPVDIGLMKTLNDVITITELQTGQYKLQTAAPDSVRKQLLELSLQHNLNIVSLRSETHSLEDIFRDLTSTNNHK